MSWTSFCWLRTNVRALAVLAAMMFVTGVRGEQPPDGAVDSLAFDHQSPADFDFDAAAFGQQRVPLPDTTLINDVAPPPPTDEPETPPFDENESPTGTPTAKWQQISDPRRLPCPGDGSCASPGESIATSTTARCWQSCFPIASPLTAVRDFGFVLSGFEPETCGSTCPYCAGRSAMTRDETVYGDVLRWFTGAGCCQVSTPFGQWTFSPVAVEQPNCVCWQEARGISCRQKTVAAVPSAAKAKIKHQAKPGTELKPGERAEVILKIMEGLGPSVLHGTLFEDPALDAAAFEDAVVDETNRETVASGPPSPAARESVIRWIRQLERNERTAPHPGQGPPRPLGNGIQGPPRAADEPIRTLREVAREMTDAAERLEDLGLYPQADHLREVAQHLRHEARGMAAAPVTTPARQIVPIRPPRPPTEPTAGDLEAELERIGEHLQRVRDALHQQRRHSIR